MISTGFSIQFHGKDIVTVALAISHLILISPFSFGFLILLNLPDASRVFPATLQLSKYPNIATHQLLNLMVFPYPRRKQNAEVRDIEST